jgi:hypothetical protein
VSDNANEKTPCKARDQEQVKQAEGMGFEPTTGFPASDFESDRSPFAYPPAANALRRSPGLQYQPGKYDADVTLFCVVFPIGVKRRRPEGRRLFPVLPINARQVGQRQLQGVGAVATAALCGQGDIQLMGQRQARHG